MNRVLMRHPLNGLTSPLRFNSVSQLVQADLTTTNVWLLFLTDKHFFYVFLKMYCFCAYSSVSQNYPLFKIICRSSFRSLHAHCRMCDDVFLR